MRIAAIVQARTGSRRLPGKVLRTILGKSVLEHIADRLRRVRGLDLVIFATTPGEADQPIVREAERLGLGWALGSEQDCVQRFGRAADKYGVEHFVRITADNPLICPENISEMLASHLALDAEVTYTADMPEGCGLGMVVMSREALARIDRETADPYQREYIDEYPLARPERFRMNVLQAPPGLRRPYRLTVDEPDDFRLMTAIYEHLYAPGGYVALPDAIALLDARPDLAGMNAHVVQET